MAWIKVKGCPVCRGDGCYEIIANICGRDEKTYTQCTECERRDRRIRNTIAQSVCITYEETRQMFYGDPPIMRPNDV